MDEPSVVFTELSSESAVSQLIVQPARLTRTYSDLLAGMGVIAVDEQGQLFDPGKQYAEGTKWTFYYTSEKKGYRVENGVLVEAVIPAAGAQFRAGAVSVGSCGSLSGCRLQQEPDVCPGGSLGAHDGTSCKLTGALATPEECAAAGYTYGGEACSLWIEPGLVADGAVLRERCLTTDSVAIHGVCRALPRNHECALSDGVCLGACLFGAYLFDDYVCTLANTHHGYVYNGLVYPCEDAEFDGGNCFRDGAC